MKELQDIVRAYREHVRPPISSALATVIHVEGSSYRRTGARMLILDNGMWFGGISGGCLEGDALKKAQYSIATRQIKLVRYDTSRPDEQSIGIGLGCEGIIDVLLTPIDADDPHNPIHTIESILSTRQPTALITVIDSSLPLFERGKIYQYHPQHATNWPAPLVSDIQRQLDKRQSTIVQYDDLHAFVEIVLPPIHVVLFGHQYDIVPMLKMGKLLGWPVSVVMPSHRVTQKIRSLAHQIYPPEHDIPYDEYTAFILMAHDFKTDKLNLAYALSTDVPYIGMLGPAKRRQRILDEIQSESKPLSPQQIDRIYNPLGLDIGATSPEEIALSAFAEIKAHFSGRRGTSLKFRKGPIHQRHQNNT